MDCDKNSVASDFGDGSFLFGDRYKCPECGLKIVTGFGSDFVEIPPTTAIKPEEYQRVRQPQFPEYEPQFHDVLREVK